MRNSRSGRPDFLVHDDGAINITQCDLVRGSSEAHASALAHDRLHEPVLYEWHKKLPNKARICPKTLGEMGRAQVCDRLLLSQREAEHHLERSGKPNVD